MRLSRSRASAPRSMMVSRWGQGRRHNRIGIEDREPSARTQHPPRFGQRLLGAGNVAKDGMEDHSVEVTIGKGQGTGVSLVEFDAGVGTQAARVLQQGRRFSRPVPGQPR